jgi:hypothetical protein
MLLRHVVDHAVGLIAHVLVDVIVDILVQKPQAAIGETNVDSPRVKAAIASHVGMTIGSHSLVDGRGAKDNDILVLEPIDVGIGRRRLKDRIEVHLVRGIERKALAD